MTSNEILMVNAAEHLAAWLHRDQADKQGLPVTLHLRHVASAVRTYGGTPEEVAAAWLHDSVEDRVISFPALRGLFPDSVCDLVFDVTRDKPDETYERYIDRITDPNQSDPRALLIKRADLEHNIERGRGKPEFASLVKRYEMALPKVLAAFEETP